MSESKPEVRAEAPEDVLADAEGTAAHTADTAADDNAADDTAADDNTADDTTVDDTAADDAAPDAEVEVPEAPPTPPVRPSVARRAALSGTPLAPPPEVADQIGAPAEPR